VEPGELDRLESLVQDWVQLQAAENPVVVAAARDPERGTRRWMVRLAGDDKAHFTVWFDLRQRALHAETQLLPGPEEPPAPLYEYLLRANEALRGVAVSIGPEDALYLRGELPVEWLDGRHLDRLLGQLYEATERLFRPAVRLAFGARFTPHPHPQPPN
jgi:hypothetical protein